LVGRIRSGYTKGLLIDGDDIAALERLVKKISEQEIVETPIVITKDLISTDSRIKIRAYDLGAFLILISVTLVFAGAIEGITYIHVAVAAINVITGGAFMTMDWVERRRTEG